MARRAFLMNDLFQFSFLLHRHPVADETLVGAVMRAEGLFLLLCGVSAGAGRCHILQHQQATQKHRHIPWGQLHCVAYPALRTA